MNKNKELPTTEQTRQLDEGAPRQPNSDPDNIAHKNFVETPNFQWDINDLKSINQNDKKYFPITEGNEAHNPDAGKSSANSSRVNLLENKLKSEFEPHGSQ